jgi:hypothetical protein
MMMNSVLFIRALDPRTLYPAHTRGTIVFFNTGPFPSHISGEGGRPLPRALLSALAFQLLASPGRRSPVFIYLLSFI